MKRIIILLIASMIIFGFSISVNAELIDRGGGLIYDTYLDITWLQDTNYSGTMMNWDDANMWAGNLNYQNYDDWRLPETPYLCPTLYNCDHSEMGHLFYVDLGGTAMNPFATSGPFINLKQGWYWSSTPYSYDQAWDFGFGNGIQETTYRDYNNLYAWAVRDGDSNPIVPEPISSILFVAGGTLLAGRRYMKRKKSITLIRPPVVKGKRLPVTDFRRKFVE